ncbi:hypothetical protein [Raineyella sp. LH-20]|uniref:hypothetical protein n=1 Tax=Raineyella sp. LH-20 TaxID=3081204 RepID=UPI002954919A|nr:hypothetical protein [Raineyella sp. LH-20]WOP18911.1 hypothetical protein R0146_01145 [Raineyella sp. LH-20]
MANRTTGRPSGRHGTRLRVPVTVRVSPDAAGDLPVGEVRSRVADAVAAACARFPLAALELCPDDVTGVAVEVRPATGAGPETSLPLQEAAAAGARDGAARAGFRSVAGRPGQVRVTEPTTEMLDPLRIRHRLDGTTYVIPSFDGGTVEVPLRETDADRTKPWLPAMNVAVTVEQAVGIAWRWHLHRHGGRSALDRELPGYYGFIRTTSGAFLRYLFLSRVEAVGPSGDPLPGRYRYQMTLDTGSFNVFALPGRGPGFSFPTSGSSVGEWFWPGGDVLPIVFAMQPQPPAKPGKERFPYGYTALPGEAGTPDPSELDPSQPAPPPDEEPSALDIAEPPRSATGTQRSFPGSETAPAVELPCVPFLAEPDVAALVDTRNLTGRIRSLAAALAIPECGFAGAFALHCAVAVAGRARGLAAASIVSAVLSDVTVRPDATGNNGFVEVKPNPTPELMWLRRLAGIAREVGDFADAVVASYLDPANARLVRIDPGDPPNAAGWAVRFLNEIQDAMRYGYEHVFAETCRAVMLQQLRSSASGIAARQQKHNFDVLVEDFGTKLEILGDVVLWPSVLLAAIQHAGKVYLRSGSVREVLAAQEVIVVDEGPPVYLPAPIDSTPQRILAIVGDDRIERRDGRTVAVHNGRDWTPDQLRETINQRRSLLNQSDPLFFQIPDLQQLVLGMERDQAFLQHYLRDLLAEMSAANARMTQKASDLDDGAYFALEASQYVKREGGKDWRGLRYTLQGIHQLADEHLAPEVRGDRLYAAGVNQALDHKADEDAIIAIASSFGIIVLGLFCAPLGAVAAAAITGAASIAFAVHDVLEAQRQTDLYRALEDPELFQHWQDVQLAQLMATISVAFSVFDAFAIGKAAHALTSSALGALRIAEKQGARTVVRLASEAVREQVIKGLTEEALQRAVRQAVHEATVVVVMNEVLPKVITPLLVPWIRQQAQEHGTAAEVDAALGPLASAAVTGGPR